jgi:hypothetical protein
MTRILPACSLAAALAALAALAACGPSRGEMLEGEFAQAIHTTPGRIDLARLFPAEWDRVCVLTPYTGRPEAERLLGFRWGGFERSGIEASEGHTLLLFLRGREVAADVLFERRDGDFAAPGRSYCLPRARAVFRAEAPERGAEWRKVVPVL